jgi:single-strand DNA-binding protein
MKTMNNAVILGGNLGSAIELTTLSSGKRVARVSIATQEFFRDKAGCLQKHTQWHNLVAWGSIAERMQMCATKGSFVIVYGKLVHRPFIDRDGNTQYFSEVLVQEFARQKPAQVNAKQSAA